MGGGGVFHFIQQTLLICSPQQTELYTVINSQSKFLKVTSLRMCKWLQLKLVIYQSRFLSS